MDWLTQFFLKSWDAVLTAGLGIVSPAIFFLCLGYVVKRKALFEDIRRAVPETGLNIQIMVFNLVFTMPIIVLCATFLSSFWLSTGLVLFSAQDWNAWSVIAVVIFAVVVGDFVSYWRHRFEHNSFLWPSHAVHHSDTEMTWLSLERFHPINRLTTLAIDSSALLILGLPPYAVVANSLVRHYYGYFIHADLPWTYGKWGVLFVSPAMHRWHHSADEVAYGHNFATVFGLWDWAFGTYYVPGPCDGPLGVVTDEIEPTLWSQLSYSFRPKAYEKVIGRILKKV
ncbi:sterol desaturase family protein [Loktanella salsilacus]|uniref:sterol desaturase family protein n=1 Tax=Loktanella salsilacus TaxID=195913 RepID=UPI0035679F0A|tara:strand:- start:246 stop:1094 length:849 start_codon:yes stop_codon:yes gene_type:complete